MNTLWIYDDMHDVKDLAPRGTNPNRKSSNLIGGILQSGE